MRLTAPLHQLQHWQAALRTIKSAQLKHLAEATGIRSAGPKPDLLTRIESDLTMGHEYPFGMELGPFGGSSGRGSVKGKGEGKRNTEMRILSIDMGIRNLAFAHLVYSPQPAPSKTTTKHTSKSKEEPATETRGTATLTAWHRLDLTTPSDQTPSSSPSLTPKEEMDQATLLKELAPAPPEERRKQRGEFSLPVYAHHAYTLLTTLLSTYKPTHILIERQRFRSAGGSAVQEWSLRVGCFEGMLWAVLHALAKERLASTSTGNGEVPIVRGVEPSRVVRYWGDRFGFKNFKLGDGEVEESEDLDDSNEDEEITQDTLKNGKSKKKGTKKTKKKPQDAKKVRIDLAGSWLDRYQLGAGAGQATDGLSTTLVLGERDAELKETAQAFSNKWHGIRRKKGDKDIGKLDDLADCLVQGMTWLEWQIAKERIVNEGPGFLLESLEKP